MSLLLALFVLALVGGLFVPVALGLGWPARWLASIVLVISMVAVGDGAGGNEGSQFRQFAWGGIFLYSTFIACQGNKGRFSLPLRAIPMSMWALLIFAALSVAWSPIPWVSTRRVVQLFGVAVLAIALVKVWSGNSLFSGLKFPVSALLLLGLVFAVAMPSLGFDADGALRAMTSHKNTWGQFSVLAIVCGLYLMYDQLHMRWGVVLFVTALVSIFLSRSGTSLVSALVCIVLIVPVRLLNRSPRFFAAIGFFVLWACSLLVMGYTILHGALPIDALIERIFGVLGKSTTLTGRTFLWELMGKEIIRHPWFGVGYGGFWTGAEGPSASLVALLNWGPPSQAHDGYLDVLNELGVVGLGLLSITLLAHLLKLWQLARQGNVLLAQLHLALLLTVLFVNVAETSLLRTTHLLWIILTVSIVEVHGRMRQHAISLTPDTHFDVRSDT